MMQKQKYNKHLFAFCPALFFWLIYISYKDFTLIRRKKQSRQNIIPRSVVNFSAISFLSQHVFVGKIKP